MHTFYLLQHMSLESHRKGSWDRLGAEYMNYPCGKANYDVPLATELAGTLTMVTDQIRVTKCL